MPEPPRYSAPTGRLSPRLSSSTGPQPLKSKNYLTVYPPSIRRSPAPHARVVDERHGERKDADEISRGSVRKCQDINLRSEIDRLTTFWAD